MIDKKLSHVPKVPLKSRGMDNLIAEILKAMKINVHDSDGTEKNLGVNTLPPEKASGKNPVTDILKIVAIASALSVILWMFGLFYSWAGFFISIVIITIAVFGLKKLFGSFINKGPEK
jgi:uncharacterized phage infection (PIP) family protein YhgE